LIEAELALLAVLLMTFVVFVAYALAGLPGGVGTAITFATVFWWIRVRIEPEMYVLQTIG
jgi:predicted Rossmann-fold nucleotide-binding protein